jgi:flagella basal body P-ring formation protein FlgA
MRTRLLLLIPLFGCVARVVAGDWAFRFELKAQATSGSQGILLGDLLTNSSDEPLPRIVLANAPTIGRPMFFTRTQVNDLLSKKAPELVCTNWTGAEKVKISRATRVLTQAVVSELLTGALQTEYVKDHGQLELRFMRPWNSVVLPDEPLSVKILEIPTSGVSPNFICRFEVFSGGETAGVYQQGLQAKVWRDVYVAHSTVMRGQLLKEADVTLEKRDVLTNREFLSLIPLDDPFVEFRENVQTGSLITARLLRLRSVVKRGRQVEAMFQDDSLKISVRAEALEDGVPGQIVRLRNLQSRREFKGKVQDEETVLVLF